MSKKLWKNKYFHENSEIFENYVIKNIEIASLGIAISPDVKPNQTEPDSTTPENIPNIDHQD